MKYLALIYDDEAAGAKASPEEQQALFNEYVAYQQWLESAYPGKKLAGDALQPTTTATTIRIRDGKRLITDGPFAETREALGGYYLFEAKDLDEAIKLAERIPSAKTGSIEVRPVMTFDT